MSQCWNAQCQQKGRREGRQSARAGRGGAHRGHSNEFTVKTRAFGAPLRGFAAIGFLSNTPRVNRTALM
jgi:hypothetical protein